MINPTGGSFPIADKASTESRFAALDGKLYFGAKEDVLHGFQLWSTDGTAGGTTRVLDITPESFGTNI